MRKNVASQTVGAQMVSASDGSAFTGSVTVSVTGDGGSQATGSVGSGACTHEGNGYHSYAPAQAETNYDHVAFTFTGSGAIPATVQIYTGFPQTGDAFARIGAPASTSISADIAVVDGKVDELTVGASPDVLIDTTIASLTNQTNFTLTDGSSDDDAYNGMAVIFTDQSTAAQKWVCFVSDYVGSTKTVTLESAPGFTVATGDSVAIMAAGGSSTNPVPASVAASDIRDAVGLASANLDTQLTAIDDYLDTEVAAIKAKTDNLPSDPADASVVAGLISGLDTKLDTIDNFVDTEVAAIKAKTDQLTFGVTNTLNVNVTHNNEVEVGGSGTEADPWGPAA